MSYLSIIEELEKVALNPKEAVVESIKNTKKKGFGCFPIYTPEEIIYAAGFIPIGMWGGKAEIKLADRYLQSFCCSIMRTNLELGIKGTYNILEGIILPTLCDTLKCVCENWKVAVPNIPIFPIVYPQNKNIDVGYSYMVEELKRIKEELEKFTGRDISENKLKEAWEIYEDYRKTMREFVSLVEDYPSIFNAKRRHMIIKAGYFMDKKIYTAEIKKIINDVKQTKAEPFFGTKVIATGLLAEPNEILEIFHENNLVFVGDDLAQESKQFRTKCNCDGNTIEKMANRIVNQEGDTFFYDPHKTRGQRLVEMAHQKKAKGVVVFMMKFCDPEEFDYPVYKKELHEAGIPILYLEIDQQINSFEQIRTRIQSFAEMLM